MSFVGDIDPSVRSSRYARQTWWLGYVVVVGGGLFIAAIAHRRFYTPFLGLSLALMLLLLLGWLIRPRATLYATLFLTAMSDQVTVWWFPFAKNLSSRESISYVADALTITPLQIALATGAATSVLRRYARTRSLVTPTPLTRPLTIFTAFVVYGFFRGLLAGGDTRAAVLEGRALLQILLVFVIVVNECTEGRHLRGALWAVLAGVVVQALLSIDYFGKLDAAERDALESLNEHGSTLGHNLLIVTFLGLLLFRVRHRALKLALLVGLTPTIFVYFVAQRRAGVASLIVAAAVVATALFWHNRRRFWLVVPLIALLFTGYVAAFWSSDSLVGFPAQAVKTVVAPNSASEEDRSSDLYRVIEAYDLNFTIRSNPLLGLGFGQPFYRPVPLPDISFFELNAYMPHNAILWIWIKTGFGGFVTMFYLFAKSIMLGAERIRWSTPGVDLVVTLSATAYLVMYGVYTYVDVSWDARNTVFLGLALAVCTQPARGRSPGRAALERPPAQESTSPAGTSESTRLANLSA